MQKPMLESIKTILKEWDSSRILDAGFEAAELMGEDPDWSDIIDTMLDKISDKNFKKYLKDIGMTEEEFNDGLYEADPDSIISGLEEYLTDKDIKDIVDSFPSPEEEEEEYYDEEGDE